MKTKSNDEIKNYYTEEIRKKINDMSFQDMKDILRDMEGTKEWFAILKYNQDRIGNVQDSFLTLDPVKEPTTISRYQGIITGILDLPDVVLNLKFKAEKSVDPEYKKEQEINDKGGAYGKY